MNEESKNEITIILDLLKTTLMKNGVSMATDTKGNIYFFDTDIYLKTKKMNGFSVNVKDMVK